MSDLEDVPAETPLSPEEAIIRRHRREKRELQGKILAMKKSVTKNDKKKKKELAEEIAKLESDLESRQKLELSTFRPQRIVDHQNANKKIDELITIPTVPSNPIEKDKDTESCSELDEQNGGGAKLSKAQKRREKKAALEKERQMRVEQETATLVEDSDWKAEDEKLVEILNALSLQVHDIPSDGHCLYRAVSHQLDRLNETLTVEDLRRKTAKYLLEHKEDFVSYLDESEVTQDYEEYCNNVENTTVWGGQVELKALSQLLQRPIRVIQAVGPPLLFGEDYPSDILILTYHRHKFKLGAHYNSVVPAEPEQLDLEFQAV